MRTMFPRPILNHELMHLPTKQGILAQFKRMPEASFVEQEVQTLLHIVILLVLAVAILLMCLADCLRQDLADMIYNLSLGGRVEMLGHGTQQSFDQEVKPAEDRVIPLNLADIVPLNPRIDSHRDHQPEGRRVEGEDSRGRGDVVVGDELGDVVCNGDSHKTNMLWIREETEDVLPVQLAAVKGSGYVDATFDLEVSVYDALRSVECHNSRQK